MIHTVTTPEWADNDVAYHAEYLVEVVAPGQLIAFGGIANFTLRL